MAHHRSAIKRIKTSAKRRAVNRQKRSRMATLIKSVIMAENKKDAEAALIEALPYLDKIASNNIIHKNKASNQKSKLTKFVSKMA
jgi:small subunit ribosomal protein S20